MKGSASWPTARLRAVFALLFCLLAIWWAAELALAAPTRLALSTTLLFQQGVSPDAGYAGSTDCWLAEWEPFTGHADDVLLHVGAPGSAGRRQPLLRFDLSAIPVNATVISATLTLQKESWTAETHRLELFPLLVPWNAAVASWNLRDYQPWQTISWSVPGAGGVDRGPLAAVTIAPKAPGPVQWEVTALVQQWVARPAENHGCLLINADAEVVRLISAEGVAAQRPRLAVTYLVDEPDRPPSVALRAPEPWQTVHGVVEIAAAATDDRAIDRVAFYAGPDLAPLGVDTAPPYTTTWDASRWAKPTPAQDVRPPVGVEALTRFDLLPLLRPGVQAHEVSTHDPYGQNSDMKNYLYRRGGEYVLLDVEGPGCIYNLWFTHIELFTRLRIYLDGETTPRIDVDPAAFFRGAYPPFVRPLVGNQLDSSGGYYSLVPIPFARSCIVAVNALPRYYHVIYHTYPSAEGISTWTGSEDVSAALALWQRVGEDPKPTAGNEVISGTVTIAPGETAQLASIAGEGSIASIRLRPSPATLDVLQHVRLRAYWDGEATPSVDAPIGPFFGSGLGEMAVRSLLLGMSSDGDYYSYFPMPFWEHARLEIANWSQTAISLTCEVQWRAEPYPRGAAGYLHARYEDRELVADGADYVLLQSRGQGHYVGTVLTMAGYQLGWPSFLEGDDRVYFDDSYTPAFYGSGTEEYFLGAWWFRYGSFGLPTHGMVARLKDTMERISCYRLHIGDLIPYASAIRFGIEHGGTNQEPAHYASVAFYYEVDVPGRQLCDELTIGDAASEAAHGYTSDGLPVRRVTYYEGDWDNIPLLDAGRDQVHLSQFTLRVHPTNRGVLLRRRRDQAVGRQRAHVYVDGEYVGIWYSAYQNVIKSWSDETFAIPAAYTAGKSAIEVRIVAEGPWNEFHYWAYSDDDTVPVVARAYDAAGQVSGDMVRVQVDLTPPATPAPTETASPTGTATPTPTVTPSPTGTCTTTPTPRLFRLPLILN